MRLQELVGNVLRRRMMKLQQLAMIVLSLALLLISSGTVHAEALGTEFTYQGRLTEDGNPVDQSCDFQFSMYDASTAGSQVGSTLTKTSVSVSVGLFSVSLDYAAPAHSRATPAGWPSACVAQPGAAATPPSRPGKS